MNESRLGVAAMGAGVCTGPGVGGTEGALGRRLNSRRENWDWMSPNDAEGVVGWRASRVVNASHNAGDSGSGEKAGLCGVGCAIDGLINEGEWLDNILDGGEK
jgi:hypothetical protein